MSRARVLAGVLTSALLTGAVTAGPSALSAMRVGTVSGHPHTQMSRTDREQARNVVRAWRMNGPYAECITERGYDGILWQSTIALAPGLVNDPKFAALHEDIAASEGDNDPDWNTEEFSYAASDCLLQNPEQRPPPPFEDVEHWAAIIAEAREHGWSPDDPFALDCGSHRKPTLAPCRIFEGR
jgi:hypothetical protein